MMTRRTKVALTCAGRDISGEIEQFVFTDAAGGESDSITASMNNRSGAWTGAYMPQKGLLLEAAIIAEHGNQEGERTRMDCGAFTLDSFDAAGNPDNANIGGVSVPADEAFRETKRTATYEKATIEQISATIAIKYGLALFYDGEEIPIFFIEQSQQTDCEFLNALCETYGLTLKVYRRKLVLFDREKYKQKQPVRTVSVRDKTAWNIQTDLAGSYTGGELSYTDPDSEEDIKVSVGTGPRILAVNHTAANRADALRQITAAVNAANHGRTALSITIRGDATLLAAQTLTIVGIGQLSGTYYIDKITHSVGEKYEAALELSMVEGMTDAVVADACASLGAVGVMNTPAYWVQHANDVENLSALLINLSVRIKGNANRTDITTAENACAVLAAAGAMNAPAYWAAHMGSVPYLDTLLIKAANAIQER